MKETELGPPVLEWLASQGYDCYQEVMFPGTFADIVATRGRELICVELKVHLSFDVLAQALDRMPYVTHSWIAVPHAKRSAGRDLALRIAEHYGIGVVVLKKEGLVIHTFPKLNRKALTGHIRPMLNPAQKTGTPAGSSTGTRWTPFKETCRVILQAVTAHPGITIDQLSATITSHYPKKYQKRNLTRIIGEGWVPGVALRKEHKTLRVVLTQKPS